MVRLARPGLYGSNSEINREALFGLMERKRRLERLDGAIPLGSGRHPQGLQSEQIEVIHVLQGARDIEARLFGSP